MRGLGLILCVVGIFIAALGVIGHFADHEGLGIAGMVVGAGFLGIGVMIFLTEFVLLIARGNASLFIRARFFKIELAVQSELRTAEEDADKMAKIKEYLDKEAEPAGG
ncbi:MAG TPA: hypothetical protein VMW64_10500 [Dehalococcoidia bacterium]|nr:hypothetical protein [Dehalococcoidia bacterium]